MGTSTEDFSSCSGKCHWKLGPSNVAQDADPKKNSQSRFEDVTVFMYLIWQQIWRLLFPGSRFSNLVLSPPEEVTVAPGHCVIEDQGWKAWHLFGCLEVRVRAGIQRNPFKRQNRKLSHTYLTFTKTSGWLGCQAVCLLEVKNKWGPSSLLRCYCCTPTSPAPRGSWLQADRWKGTIKSFILHPAAPGTPGLAGLLETINGRRRWCLFFPEVLRETGEASKDWLLSAARLVGILCTYFTYLSLLSVEVSLHGRLEWFSYNS